MKAKLSPTLQWMISLSVMILPALLPPLLLLLLLLLPILTQKHCNEAGWPFFVATSTEHIRKQERQPTSSITRETTVDDVGLTLVPLGQMRYLNHMRGEGGRGWEIG